MYIKIIDREARATQPCPAFNLRPFTGDWRFEVAPPNEIATAMGTLSGNQAPAGELQQPQRETGFYMEERRV